MTRFPCPPGCVDHYTVDDTRNHDTMPRTVTCADADTGEPREVSVWMEQRDTADGWELVGVLEQVGRNDVEFSSYQMRELAAHIVAVADQMDATAADLVAAVRPSTRIRVRRRGSARTRAPRRTVRRRTTPGAQPRVAAI